MSLKIWLPLDGDLRNLCASVYNITAINTPVFMDGKIGQCYQRASSDTQSTNGININNNLVEMLGTQASVAVWVKPLGTHTHYNGTIISSGNWNGKKWAFGVSQDNNQVDVLCGSYNNYISCAVPINEWTHLVSTFNNGTCKLYKNGIYIGEKTGQAAFVSDATNTCIGRETYASGYFGFNGLINDVRIYDHCLSAAEVREIAQSLVLHYKLDGPLNGVNYNLGNYSQRLDGAAASSANSNWSKRGSSTIVLANGIGEVHCSSTSFQGVTICANNLNLQIDSTYTISCYAYTNVDSGAHISFYPMMFNSSGTRDTTSKLPISIMGDSFVEANARSFGTNSLLTTPTLYYASFIWNQAMQDILNEGGYIDLTLQVLGTYTEEREDILYLPKLETGLKATERIGSLFDLHLNPLLVSDSSGYNYNGTITDIVEYNPDSPRQYTEAIYFPNNLSGIEIPNIPMNIFNEENTISFWIKPYNENGQRSIYCSSYSGNSYSIEKRVDNKLRIWWAGTPDCAASKLTIDDNVWQHITIVKAADKENLLLYKNGQYVETITNDFADKNWSGIYRIGRDYRDENIAYIGQMSDFRVYTTALSAKEIMDLYMLGARIDKNKNVYSDEFIEEEIINYNNLITRFTRQKQIITDEFIETDNTASLQNGIVLSNQLIEL